MNSLKIRKSKISDIKQIHKLVNGFARKEQMLPIAFNDLYEGIRDFFVFEENNIIKGVCALKILWEDLGEIRSLAIKKKYQKQGIGKSLIKKCLKEARQLELKKIFSLTYHPDFFEKLGFKQIDKSKLPQKIWRDCFKCHKFPECDEQAMIIYLQKKIDCHDKAIL